MLAHNAFVERAYIAVENAKPRICLEYVYKSSTPLFIGTVRHLYVSHKAHF